MPNQSHSNILRKVFTEFFLRGDLTNYEQYIAKDITVHCPPSWKEIHASELSNREDSKEVDKEYAKAFKMEKVDILDMIEAKDKVVLRWSCQGKHINDFFKYKASQKTLNLTGLSIYRFSPEGTICEVWQSWDMLGLLQQIGKM